MDQNPDGVMSMLQKRFCMLVARPDYSPGLAAREVGYKHCYQYARQLMKLPKIQKAIIKERRKYEKAALVSRAEIIETFREAIDMARMKADPAVMIKGATELGTMCGYYQQGDTKLTINPNGQVVLEQVKRMTDDELLALASEDMELEDRTIEGESSELVQAQDEIEEAMSYESPRITHAEETADGVDIAQSNRLRKISIQG